MIHAIRPIDRVRHPCVPADAARILLSVDMNVTQKLIASKLIEGALTPGEAIAITVDQTLTQDATGTLVMLGLEAIDLDHTMTDVSVQYVDHNLLQSDEKNADDHRFLASACAKYGIWFSPPGNGVSHPLHMSYFGVPGKVLLGSDSHTCAAGAIGMLAVGAGGMEVVAAMSDRPYELEMPAVLGVELVGRLPEWVSAKDVILTLLQRHGVRGCVNKVIEYFGPGVRGLSVWDRHVIANMGAELGATTSVFPADATVESFMRRQGRPEDFVELKADEDAEYDERDRIDLSALEPMIACPSSPGSVVPVREVQGKPVEQCYLGSSANPGLRDFAVPARMLDGRRIATSLEVNPPSRDVLLGLGDLGLLAPLLAAGARLHQSGCNGCIGMGQAPPSGGVSLRTVPRNFPGRSGTTSDQVYLCSPETVTASAIAGKITDPRTQSMTYPSFRDADASRGCTWFIPPAATDGKTKRLIKGPHIGSLPVFDSLEERLELPALIRVGDDVSTDEILPAGADVLPYRSNIEKISEFVLRPIDSKYAHRAGEHRGSGSLIVAGENYGQGSSREHAALAPRVLGVRCVIAKSFARIHRRNLINFGVLPLRFADSASYDRLAVGDRVILEDLGSALGAGRNVDARVADSGAAIELELDLSAPERAAIRAGGLINLLSR